MTRTQSSRRRVTSGLLLLAGLTIGICTTAALTDHSPTGNPHPTAVVVDVCPQGPAADTGADNDDQHDASIRALDYTLGSGYGWHPQRQQQSPTNHTAPPSRHTQPPSPPPG